MAQELGKMARTAPLLGLIALLACPQVGPEVPDSGAPPPAIKVVFLQAQDGAFYANPEINAVLPVRLRAEEAETVQVSLAGTAKNAQRLDDGSWVAEFNIEGLEDGTVAVDALALKGAWRDESRFS